MRREHLRLWTIGAAYAATWFAVSWLAVPALDSYGDMVENYAWSQTWAWGTFRHPPFFAWVVGAWFSIFPTTVWSYYALSYVNAGAGVAGIVCLAGLCLPQEVAGSRRQLFLATVWLFAALAFPYSNLAAKFNADTVLLSLWPWTAYAFLGGLHAAETRRKWMFALLLAALAAAAMLAKYYSGLLLASLFLVSLSHRDYRRWYRTPYPYVTGAVFVLLLLPHMMWQVRMRFPIGQYLESKIDPAVDFGRIALFVLSGFYYLPLSWLAWLVLRVRFGTRERRAVAWVVPIRAIVLLVAVPAILTAAFNVFGRVHLTTHWAIPIWYALPVLLGIWLLPAVREDGAWRRFLRGFSVLWAMLAAGALVYTLILSMKGEPKYSLGRQEMVRAIEGRFRERFPEGQLSWAGGTWPEVGSLAFFGTNHPRALPGFPDEGRALVSPYPEWDATYGVILCYSPGTHAREGTYNSDCETLARAWLAARNRSVQGEILRYRASGWRFIKAQPKNVSVYWVPPAR